MMLLSGVFLIDEVHMARHPHLEQAGLTIGFLVYEDRLRAL